jgi:dUTP pyrophosphatase
MMRTGPTLVSITRLPHADGVDLPAYATDASAGLDLGAAVAAPVEIAPGARALIPTGFAIALPQGFEAQVRPRSGLALKHGVTVLNSPGTIDADYRGEVGVILANFGTEPFTVTRGLRIAQLVVAPVARVAWQLGDTLPDSRRGAGGFGSTGEAQRAGADAARR